MFIKFYISCFTLLVIGILNCNAQVNPCNLQLNVLEFGSNGLTEKNIINDTKSVLTDLISNKTIKSVPLTKKPTFANLSSNKYKIDISKVGFQRRIKEIEVDCDLADETGTVFETVFLWKGNPNEVTKINSELYTVSNDNSDSQAVKVENTGDTKTDGKAFKFVTPKYPPAARAVGASGEVKVQVTIDEDGNVVSAQGLNGHPLLKVAAEKAARQSKFSQTIFKGNPVIVTGVIVYNFRPQ